MICICTSFLEIVVWSYDTFDLNFGIEINQTKYLKGSCWQWFDKHFFFKYFPKYGLWFYLKDLSTFVRLLPAAVSINGLVIVSSSISVGMCPTQIVLVCLLKFYSFRLQFIKSLT